MRVKKKRVLLIVGLILLTLGAVCGAYFGIYAHAAPEAAALLRGGGGVQVKTVDAGWLLDGPGTENALIFYPGGKVEATAYLPLLTTLAADGIDCFLLQVPLNLAIFDVDAAGPVQAAYSYDRWYVGGHSLGGVCAAMYAAENADRLSGLILLAAYPAGPLPEGLQMLTLRGSRDGVLDLEKYEESRGNWPRNAVEQVIEGGNHAGFGDYGPQRGDLEPDISPEAQRAQAAEAIAAFCGLRQEEAS